MFEFPVLLVGKFVATSNSPNYSKHEQSERRIPFTAVENQAKKQDFIDFIAETRTIDSIINCWEGSIRSQRRPDYKSRWTGELSLFEFTLLHFSVYFRPENMTVGKFKYSVHGHYCFSFSFFAPSHFLLARAREQARKVNEAACEAGAKILFCLATSLR